MKKILIGLATAASIVAPVATIVACGSTAGVTVTSKEKVPTFAGTKITGKKLGAIVSDPENPRWQKSKSYLQSNGEAAGFATSTSIAKAAADQKTWITANLAKLDALIVGATDDSVAGSWSNWSTSAKPVVAYDRLIKKDDSAAYNWYITYNNALVGDLQAKNILAAVYGNKSLATKSDADILTYIGAHKLSKEKSIVTVAGDPADNNAGLFFNGAMKLLDEAIKKDSKLVLANPVFDKFDKVAQDKWDYAKGQTFLQAQISNLTTAKKAEIAAVLSPNDGMATSAINALRNNALDPKAIYITGQDSNDTAIISISNGTGQDMTISKPDSQATAVAVGLVKYLIDHPAQNVKPGAAIKDSDILSAIKKDFGNIAMQYDGKTYEASKGHPINTILLTPKVVDKANLDQFFSVTKK